MKGSTRNFGLDLVRSVAIGLVLAAHCLLFLFRYYFESLRELFGIFGCFGVEIFFVLSGFLIGQLIIKEVLRPPSGRGLLHFYARRWFRTLPPYFLVLFLRNVMGYPLHWRYFVFLQNFDPKVAGGFPISWSLAVEEWFYLLTPLILLAVALLGRRGSPKAFFLTCGSIGAAALLGRVAYVLVAQPLWDPAVRQHIFLRMDTLMIGVLLGGLRVYDRPRYDRLAQNRRILGLLGLGGLSIATAWLFVGIRNLSVNGSFLLRTVFFDLLAISVALLILALESSPAVNERWTSRWWAGAVRYVSLSSYSLYLIHLSAFEPFLAINSRQGSLSTSVALMAAALAASLALAGAMYRWFEKPVLRIRDRLAAPVFIERTPASDPSGSEGERS
jgi:peptidoglycan/LPS O-acetylase OafA/YrhL